MINNLVIGIAQAINAHFGDTNEIYCEDIEQDLKAPCFLIVLLEAENERLVGDRYNRKQPFDIHYFPSSNSKIEMYSVKEKLYDALELITFNDGLLLGRNMRGEIVDGVLHFFIDYNFTVIKKHEADYMKELEIRGRINSYGN